MAGIHESEEQSPTLYRPIPELKDPQRVIASEVDTLLDAVIKRTQASTEQLQQFGEQLQQKDDPEWLLERKKHFLAALLRKEKDPHLPETFFPLLMRIAVYEANPSFNRGFIEPCLRAFGYRKVQEDLLTYLMEGTNREKAGAVRAFYWAKLPLLLPEWNDLYPNRTWQDQEALKQALEDFWNELEKAQQAFQKMCDEELADLRSTIAITMLKEFIENDDIDVRRSLVPQLSFDPLRYPEEWQSLIPLALSVARAHPDDYIRHRVEIHLKNHS
jgi:hypothetical protein